MPDTHDTSIPTLSEVLLRGDPARTKQSQGEVPAETAAASSKPVSDDDFPTLLERVPMQFEPSTLKAEDVPPIHGWSLSDPRPEGGAPENVDALAPFPEAHRDVEATPETPATEAAPRVQENPAFRTTPRTDRMQDAHPQQIYGRHSPAHLFHSPTPTPSPIERDAQAASFESPQAFPEAHSQIEPGISETSSPSWETSEPVAFNASYAPPPVDESLPPFPEAHGESAAQAAAPRVPMHEEPQAWLEPDSIPHLNDRLDLPPVVEHGSVQSQSQTSPQDHAHTSLQDQAFEQQVFVESHMPTEPQPFSETYIETHPTVSPSTASAESAESVESLPPFEPQALHASPEHSGDHVEQGASAHAPSHVHEVAHEATHEAISTLHDHTVFGDSHVPSQPAGFADPLMGEDYLRPPESPSVTDPTAPIVESAPQAVAPAPTLDADAIAERLQGRFSNFLAGDARHLIEARCREALQEHSSWLVSQVTREVASSLEMHMAGWVREVVAEELARHQPDA